MVVLGLLLLCQHQGLSCTLLAHSGLVSVYQLASHAAEHLSQDFSEWAQCQVLEFASHYRPSGEQEVYDFMNVLDDRLSHSNSAVVMATVKMFLHYTLSMPATHQQVMHSGVYLLYLSAVMNFSMPFMLLALGSPYFQVQGCWRSQRLLFVLKLIAHHTVADGIKRFC